MPCVNRTRNVRPAGWPSIPRACGREPRLERASAANRPGPPASILAEPHDERVVLVVESGPLRQSRFESLSQHLVALLPPDGAVTEQDAPGVGVDDERPPGSCI